MKKGWIFTMLIFGMFLLACNKDGNVTMSNIDEHLGKSNTVYIDLRSLSEMQASGYIDGFSRIAFYEDIVDKGILRNTTTWNFRSSDLLNEDALRNLFDETQTIYIMCRSGNRSGYVVQALRHIGYKNVYNIGGIIDYRGDHLVYP